MTTSKERGKAPAVEHAHSDAGDAAAENIAAEDAVVEPVPEKRAPTSTVPTQKVERGAKSNVERVATESELVIRAQAALKHNPKRALAITRKHLEHYPHGRMREEADRVALKALVKLKRYRRAVTRADDFIARYPRSVYGPHVRKLREEAFLQSRTSGA